MGGHALHDMGERQGVSESSASMGGAAASCDASCRCRSEAFGGLAGTRLSTRQPAEGVYKCRDESV